MDEWFQTIAADFVLPDDVAQQLSDIGYVVMEGPIAPDNMTHLTNAYDAAVATAHPDDVSRKSSTRVRDFLNRDSAFDEIYLYKPLLAACCHVIGRPFKLSSLLARTVEPGASAQALHADFRRYDDGWPMVGFILMIDEFRSDNGATRFVPGSHLFDQTPGDVMEDATAEYNGQALACGAAGSIVIYNGSVWHGFTANVSAQPRRSIQGAFIRREATPAISFSDRMRPETLARISDLAKYLLHLNSVDEV